MDALTSELSRPWMSSWFAHGCSVLKTERDDPPTPPTRKKKQNVGAVIRRRALTLSFWAMDALGSERTVEHGRHHGWLFSERITPWTLSWLGHGCSVLTPPALLQSSHASF